MQLNASNMMNITNKGHISLCFKSRNNSCLKTQFYPTIVKVMLYALQGAITLLTVFGNLLVVITVLRFKQFHTPTNYLILSLALADLLVGAFLMPFMMVYAVESCWYTGQLHCKIHMVLGVMLCAASIFTLCFIAADRYVAVCYPLSYQTKISTPLTKCIIFLTWSIAALIGFCSSLLANQNKDTKKLLHAEMCEGACFMFHNTLSVVLFPTIGIYFPGVIMSCMYMKIYHIARRHALLIQDKQSCLDKSKVASRTEIKATRTLAIVMGVFLSSWFPFYISNLLYPTTGYSPPLSLIHAFIWIACLNSMCNPIIYALFYSWFRRAFKTLLFGNYLYKFLRTKFCL